MREAAFRRCAPTGCALCAARSRRCHTAFANRAVAFWICARSGVGRRAERIDPVPQTARALFVSGHMRFRLLNQKAKRPVANEDKYGQ